jgi:hypothetical protein
VRCAQPEQQIGQGALTQTAHGTPGQPRLHRGQHRARMNERPPVAPQHDLADMTTLQAATSTAMLSQHAQLFIRGRCRALSEQLYLEATEGR